MSAPNLELRLLGQFEIRLDGQVVDLPSRPAQSLLAYLALTAPTAHRRELLAGLLWPDSTDSNARGYLRQALWRVRKAIGDEYLIADELAIAFNGDGNYWLDAAELQRDLSTTASTDELTQTLLVYQGQLLPGFYFDWADLERERLQSTFETRLAVLMDKLTAERRWPQVLEWGERWIALGQVPEPAYRALMLARHSLGDRSGMAAIYQRCVDALERELSVEPSPATRELYERLLQDAPAEHQPPFVIPERKVTLAPVPSPELPHALTTFIGREQEVAEVVQLLTPTPIPSPSPDEKHQERGRGAREGGAGVRLLTLTGTGGSGKTRLALQVSEARRAQFPNGIWFVELAPLTDPALVARAVASTLGVVEQVNRSITATIAESLRTRQCLLILDNCEHVIEACALLTQSLLRSCPQLRVLATSREPLGIAGETVYQVPPLSVPDGSDSVAALMQSDAVQLFIDRARLALPGFNLTPENAPAIAEICLHLDGLPLAIELAAARVKLLPPDQIAARLNDRFRLLTGGNRTLMPHQQTLRATMDWSYNLIDEAECDLFVRLSVFIGGWTLEAAEAVCAGESLQAADILDLLAQLVNKSLVMAEQGGAGRYHMLESIRQYAHEKLVEYSQHDLLHARHLAYYLSLAEQAEPHLIDPQQVAWLNRLETEIDNIRAALDWAVHHDALPGMQLATRLMRFWDGHDHFSEGANRIGQFVDKPEVKQYPVDRAWALVTQSILLAMNDLPAVQTNAQTALELFRPAGDRKGTAYSLLALGIAQALHGDFVAARPLLDESLALFEAMEDKLGQSEVFSWLTMDRRFDIENCIDLIERSLELSREIGHTLGILSGLVGLAQQWYWMGNMERALPLLDEAWEMQETLGSKSGRAWIWEMRGNIALRQGDDEKAEEYLNYSLPLHRSSGHHVGGLWAYINLAAIAARKGELGHAHQLLADTIQRFYAAQIKNGVVYSIENYASLAVMEGDPARAAKLLAWADMFRQEIGDIRPHVEQVGVRKLQFLIKARLPAEARRAAAAEGEALTYEQAIAYAVGKDS